MSEFSPARLRRLIPYYYNLRGHKYSGGTYSIFPGPNRPRFSPEIRPDNVEPQNIETPHSNGKSLEPLENLVVVYQAPVPEVTAEE